MELEVKFPSKSKTITRLQKEFLTLLKSVKKRKRARAEMHPHWLLIREMSQELLKPLNKLKQKRNEAKDKMIKEINSPKFTKIVTSDELTKYKNNASFATSEYESFIKTNKYLKGNKKINREQAIRNTRRQIESMFTEEFTLDPVRHDCYRKMKREYFNRPPASVNNAKVNAIKYFKSIEKEIYNKI
ncbi:hypothetical protein [Leptospira saintgironsiae]|uniref:hypothetical protein n=1 Tax=Leptospira saintgironsiae TaxID=2023183 RepID=UPI000F636B88|nr:hypothetical protein [Leptospira saintgironsiae]